MIPTPELPRLFYSTWGADFYSENWLKPVNCWMFAMIKFVEANIDFQRDVNAIAAFEEFSGSDLMFIYPDETQRERVHALFIRQFHAVAKHLAFAKREVSCAYPVDPFKSLFVYATLDKPLEKPVFFIDRKSDDEKKVLHQVSIDPLEIQEAGLFIYYQFFIVPPETKFHFRVEKSSCEALYASPDFGIPLYVVQQLKVRPKYNQSMLYKKIESVWGHQKDVIPLIAAPNRHSKSVFTKKSLESLLSGKRSAIFKYNKEFYSLLRFNELFPCCIEVVFDDKVCLEDASSYAHISAKKIPVVNDFRKIEEYEFDVIILTCAINFDSEIEFFRSLMRYAVNRKIQVLSLYDDALHYDVFEGGNVNEGNFYRIGLPRQAHIPDKKSPQNSPENVLAVFGTDTVQGKFTTQLYLREALKKHVRVAHWATEPTGCLLGADIGYSRTDDALTAEQRLVIERESIKELAQGCDLVITGGQNSIVYAASDSEKEDNVSTVIFDTHLPRYVVLTVSVDTAVKQIEESIAYVAQLAVKNQISSRVVALAMMGGRKIRGSRWTETYFAPVDAATIATARKKLHDVFGLPLYVIPDEIDDLAKQVATIDMSNG